jgi:histidine ammonia-lyase
MMTKYPIADSTATREDKQIEELLSVTTGGEAFVEVAQEDAMALTPGTSYHVTENKLTGEGTLWRRVPGDLALSMVDLQQVELRAKEGLALNNGATFSAAIAALAYVDAWNLIENAEVALALTLEAVRGFRDPFFPRVHELRGHKGAQETSKNVLEYVEGSTLLDIGDEGTDPGRCPPQDFYSVRCAPQVLGTVRDTLGFVKQLVDIEINAVTDNPLVLMDLDREYKTVSCGNFHGEPIAMGMDFLGIAVTEVGNISDRRMFNLMEYHLPAPRQESPSPGGQNAAQQEQREDPYRLDSFLVKEDDSTRGLNSGFMIAQYSAASLVSDSKTLAHPDSVDSIPSSANKEDHVSMSLNAARHAREIVENIEAVVAIELLCAAQAVELWQKKTRALGDERRLGKGTQAVFKRIRQEVPYLDFDRVLYPDIRALLRMVRSGELVRAAREG